MRWFLILLFAGIAIGILLNCSDSDPVGSGPGGTQVTISGTIYGLWCPDGPNPGDPRYSVEYDQPASIKVIDGSTRTRSIQTDTLSTFSISAYADTFTLVVETPHSRPDTFRNIAVVSDTSLKLRVFLDFHEIESLILDFFYQPASDSVGESIEKRYLRLLERLTSADLDIEHARREVHTSEYGSWSSVTYFVPMTTRRPFWQIADALYIAFHDSTVIPVHMALENAFTICYDASTLLSPPTSPPLQRGTQSGGLAGECE